MEEPVPSLKQIAYCVASNILADAFATNNGFPITGFHYTIDNVPFNNMPHQFELIREELFNNKEEFEAMVNNMISNRLKYIVDEGFAYEKRGVVKLYTKTQIAKQLENIE